MTTIWDFIARLRLGRPPPGEIRYHPTGSFAFEEGAEVPERLRRVFGDLGKLSCIDLGCGPVEAPIARDVFNVPWARLISVEAFPPYIEKLRGKQSAARRHEIQAVRIEEALRELPPGEIDLAVMIDVVEHFRRRQALDLLARLERLVRRGIVVFSPIGEVAQNALDHNELQRHRSSWQPRDWARLGYAVEVYEAFHGFLDPPATAAWAIKKLSD